MAKKRTSERQTGQNGKARSKDARHDSESNHEAAEDSSAVPSSPPRRRFLGQVGTVTAATIAATLPASPALAQGKCNDDNFPFGIEPASMIANRYTKSYEYRLSAAKMAKKRPLVYHVNNGDEARYPSKIASHTKALPHNQLGEVDPAAYATLAKAIATRSPLNFEAITLGGVRKLTSPQAGLAMDLEGPDSHHITLPAAPRFDSAEEAGEAVELYWMALARDINFTDYGSDPLIAQAAQELSNLSDFRGPKQNGQVTPSTIFRGNTPGDLAGHWLSQFLLLDFYFGANFVSQRMRTVVPEVDYLTQFADWLAAQNGQAPGSQIQYDPIPRYIRNLRDLAEWVHIDALYQAYLHACLILMGQGTRVDPGLPLADSLTQDGFAQCGGPHILSLVTEVATRALKAVWYQKWFIHNRLRPEEYGGRVHNRKIGAANYPIHPDILNSQALAATFSKYGTYLLPQAFPEGCPTHPSYGSGHATVAGACTTILKAFFDETDTIKNPMVPTADGTLLVSYDGPPLTVLGELNKVAMNVATGRNGAGIHWRSDAVNSLKLGEEVAVCILQEQRGSYNDNVTMSLTKFDGTKIII
jgi:hypothetical protein